MEYFQILSKTCSTDISSCCSDYGIATYLYFFKKVVLIFQIAVPIILILMATIGFIQLMADPDDKNKAKTRSVINKFVAAFLVFFIPYFFNLIIGLLSKGDFDTFTIAKCWEAADDIYTVMQETEEWDAITNDSKKVKYELDNSSDTKFTTKSKKKKSKSKSKSKSGSTSGEKVAEYAQKFIGNPYVWGGNSLTKGVDCSGFVKEVYAHFGYTLQRTSSAQASDSKYKTISNPTRSNLEPGDLLFYKNGSRIGHVAMYIGKGKIVHASNRKDGIKISSYNYRAIAKAKRIIS